MAVTEKISKLVQNQFPAFYKEEGPKFLAFMEAYYEYMEQNGKLTDGIRNLQSYSDIDTTTEEYLDYFLYTFVPSLPVDVLAKKELLVKNIKQGNFARGTLQSYKLLFRVLYDEDIDLVYPADQILKVSDADWQIDRYLTSNYDDRTYSFIGKTIIGVDSRAIALVEDVVARNVKGRHLMQILLSNVEGTFKDKEVIHLQSDTDLSGHRTVIDAGISKVEIISPGAEYRVGDIVNINSSGIGDFGKVVVTDVQDLGGVVTFEISKGGSGYATTTDEYSPTSVKIEGGNYQQQASFQIYENDLDDKVSFSFWGNEIGSNTVFGDLAPAVDNIITGVDPIKGTVTSTSGNNTVIGVDTTFNSELEVGDDLYAYPSRLYLGTVSVISNNDVLTTTGTVDLSETQVTYERTKTLSMNTFANTILGAPHFGFKEQGEELTSGVDFRDNEQAKLYFNSDVTSSISVEDSLFQAGTGANAEVQSLFFDGSNTVITVNTYKSFDQSGTVYVNSPDLSSGSVGAPHYFTANTISKHQVSFGVVPGAWTPVVGDKIVGVNSNCFGVIQELISNTENSYTHDPDGVAESRTLWTVKVSSNNSSALTDQFEYGPILGDTVYTTGAENDGEGSKKIIIGGTSFHEQEGIRLVDNSTVLANVASASANNVHENIATPIEECLVLVTSQVGTITNLSDIDSGSGYTNEPIVTVTNPDIAALGIGESILTLESTDEYWNTGASNAFGGITDLDSSTGKITGSGTDFADDYSVDGYIEFQYNSQTYTLKITAIGEGDPLTNQQTVMFVDNLTVNATGQYLAHSLKVKDISTVDRLVQTSTGAIGDVKSVTVLNGGAANDDGKYQAEVRVWQRPNQRTPGNINWETGTVRFEKLFGEYIFGVEEDTRPAKTEGDITIASITDLGVLGQNAEIDVGVGADGTITGLRVLDSGFSYLNNEQPLLEDSGRGLASGARINLTLSGVANAEGYYSTDRSHLSTTRGYIQDSDYYQEFSYEIVSKNSLSRYRDIALNLIHPAGQKLFGKYRSVSDTNVQTTVMDPSENYQGVEKLIKTEYTADLQMTDTTGTAVLTPDSFNVTFAGINPQNAFVSQQKFNFTVPSQADGSGSITITNNSDQVTGTGFNTQFQAGDNIYLDAGNTLVGTVSSVTDDSNLEMTSAYTGSTITVAEGEWYIVGPENTTGVAFRTDDNSQNLSGLTTSNHQVYLNGEYLTIGVDYTLNESGNGITITGVVSTNDIIELYREGSIFVVEKDPASGINPHQFFRLQINKVKSSTEANLQSAWTYGNVTSANVFYNDGNTIVPSSGTFAEFSAGDTIVLKTSEDSHRFVINTISTDPAAATIKSKYVGPNIQSADVYYIQGQD